MKNVYIPCKVAACPANNGRGECISPACLKIESDGVCEMYKKLKYMKEHREREKFEEEPDLTKCPNCGGRPDNGYDGRVPPHPYWCCECEENYISSFLDTSFPILDQEHKDQIIRIFLPKKGKNNENT